MQNINLHNLCIALICLLYFAGGGLVLSPGGHLIMLAGIFVGLELFLVSQYYSELAPHRNAAAFWINTAVNLALCLTAWVISVALR